MRIGVVGGGFVGNAVARGFMEWSDGGVRVYDVVPEKSSHTLSEVLECDYVFVCLPTPMSEDGSCNTRIVEDFFAASYNGDATFILKSTVTPGTTARIAKECGMANLVHP